MKEISTLVPDIYALFEGDHKWDPQNSETFGRQLTKTLHRQLSSEAYKPRLRMSNIGGPCDRKIWYSVNLPEAKEPLRPSTRIKFLFGDILELLLLWFAKEAGHHVAGEQDLLDISGVRGRRDAVIDGIVIDTKSASSRSFEKFAKHLQSKDDTFGYLAQLGSYLAASINDPLVMDKDVAAFLVINKEKGEICLDVHPRTDTDYSRRITDLREQLAKETPPPRAFEDQPEGKSGNRKLGTVCGYCDFKETCWPGLRTFLYSNKPVFLTHVAKEPKVPELGKECQKASPQSEDLSYLKMNLNPLFPENSKEQELPRTV